MLVSFYRIMGAKIGKKAVLGKVQCYSFIVVELGRISYCHNGSCSQSFGNPIAEGRTEGYLASKAFKSATNVL